MAEENEAMKKDVSQLDDSQLAETNGGFDLGDLFRRGKSLKHIHKGCGGTIYEHLPFGLALYCSKCGESHSKLEDFEYYTEGLDSPFSDSSVA